MEAETSFVFVGLALALGSFVASGLIGFLGGRARDKRLELLEQDANLMLQQIRLNQQVKPVPAKPGKRTAA